ncbi:YqgE/AlgH family protein [Polaribacter vadi]|uniref:YqgE/AlgH family protein n=1 Tax=Polaribacter TaxID=52959 RepID=UPI001C08D1A0|nr:MULTISPECIES: YqgE/AlgH family protein [Polaribacter]MBU3012250.1 YqgE/AlgH family protein [Polaribacter vadi]MDO6742066.1 YqgE/AlgH family protein [Polaribacter sp. 1_MG-2023]
MPYLKPLKGRLLIAEPSILNDSSFNRAIVLITEHTDYNSVGFILNRPLDYTLQDLIPEIDSDFTIYQGGPVEQDNLYFVHKVPELIPESVEVANGIYWGGNFDSLKQLLNDNLLEKSDIRFFLGYSGWGKHQLKDEININSWFISENDIDNIFSKKGDSLWRNKILQKGGDYKLWANAPSDIQLN